MFALEGTVAAFGQSSFGIKIYQNTDIFDAEVTDTDTKTTTTVHNVNAHRFTIALNLVSKRKVTHEIELFIPEVSKELDNMKYPMEYNQLQQHLLRECIHDQARCGIFSEQRLISLDVLSGFRFRKDLFYRLARFPAQH